MKKYRLPQGFTQKWLVALRSGEYPQASGSLYKQDIITGYCCLGVAGSICGMSNEELEDKGLFSESFFHEIDKLPVPKELIGIIGENDLVSILAHMNDGIYDEKSGLTTEEIKRTFPQIADWVEANVEQY